MRLRSRDDGAASGAGRTIVAASWGATAALRRRPPRESRRILHRGHAGVCCLPHNGRTLVPMARGCADRRRVAVCAAAQTLPPNACHPDPRACCPPKEATCPDGLLVHGWVHACPIVAPIASFPRGRFLLAHKPFFARPAKARRAPRAATSPTAKLPLRAHPRLVHGFLVRIAEPSAAVAASASRARSPAAGPRAPGLFPSEAKHEGPPDDATFH